MTTRRIPARDARHEAAGANVDPALYEAWRRGQEWLENWLSEHQEGATALPEDGGASAEQHRALCTEIGLAKGAASEEIARTLTRLASTAWPRAGADSSVLARVRALLEPPAARPEPRPTRASATFLCAACREENDLDIDLEDGPDQTFPVECAVCCRPNDIHVRLDPEGGIVSIDATLEQY